MKCIEPKSVVGTAGKQKIKQDMIPDFKEGDWNREKKAPKLESALALCLLANHLSSLSLAQFLNSKVRITHTSQDCFKG